jgi:hypothetical protein
MDTNLAAHVTIMRSYRDRISESRFVTWQQVGKPTWRDARARLA